MYASRRSTLWVCGSLAAWAAMLLVAAVLPTLRLTAAEARAAVPQAARAPAKGGYVGPGSCAATACHGSIKPAPTTPNGVRIQQTEYTTWVTKDRHAIATRILADPVSVRMGQILGLKQAPKDDPKCLACHGLEGATGSATARNFMNDGVSCEACHGAASGWLGAHVTKEWRTKPADVLGGAGMYNTKDVQARATRCAECHVGTDKKFVDHEMIAAGHPDLVFDLQFFSDSLPRHWRESEDVKSDPNDRREPFRAAQFFTVGQLVHLEQNL